MKKLVILGGGESGCGAAVLAKKKGYEVFLSDNGSIKKKYQKLLTKEGVKWEEGGHTNDLIFLADEVVKSPGIPDSIPLLMELRARCIPVISEIEFGYRYTDAKIIAVTGSNGKTTTSLLLAHILKKSGFSIALAGNIGESFS